MSLQAKKSSKPTSLFRITADFEPPETLGHFLKQRINKVLNEYTHVAVIDRDIFISPAFLDLPDKYPEADIIGAKVKPSSLLHRIWETTYTVKLKPRIRGGAIIYSTAFLTRVGGYPDVTTPDTWLEIHAKLSIGSAVEVIHEQAFDLNHSIQIQIRDGLSRAELNYPLWKTVLHSIVRLRPLVLYAYAKERLRSK